jgi:hypothetical protein
MLYGNDVAEMADGTAICGRHEKGREIKSARRDVDIRKAHAASTG